MSKQISEQTVLFMSILKWVFLAVIIGIIVGTTTTIFLKFLEFSLSHTSKYWYLLILIPIALFLNSLIKKYIFPEDDVETTNQVIDCIHNSKSISWKSAVKAFFLPIITLSGGGSAGKEAPCADVGAAAGSIFSKIFKLSKTDKQKLMICGVSSGFAAVFGTPIAGAIFGVEVLFIGGLLYEVLLPSLIAGLVAYQVAITFGITYFTHTLDIIPVFSNSFFVLIVAAGIFFGMISFITIEFFHLTKKLSLKIKLWDPLKALIAGTIIIVLVLLFSDIYLGLGLNTIEGVVTGSQVVWYAFLIKLLFTSLTLNFGGSGGLVTPVLFIGATSGFLFANVLSLDTSTFAAIGLVAVLAGVANAPISASILSIELFGPTIAPYAAVACVISFLMTGHRSLFLSQVLSIRKSSLIIVPTGKKISRTKTKFQSKNVGAIKYVINASEKKEELKKNYNKSLEKYKKDLTK